MKMTKAQPVPHTCPMDGCGAPGVIVPQPDKKPDLVMCSDPDCPLGREAFCPVDMWFGEVTPKVINTKYVKYNHPDEHATGPEQRGWY